MLHHDFSLWAHRSPLIIYSIHPARGTSHLLSIIHSQPARTIKQPPHQQRKLNNQTHTTTQLIIYQKHRARQQQQQRQLLAHTHATPDRNRARPSSPYLGGRAHRSSSSCTPWSCCSCSSSSLPRALLVIRSAISTIGLRTTTKSWPFVQQRKTGHAAPTPRSWRLKLSSTPQGRSAIPARISTSRYYYELHDARPVLLIIQ